MPKENNKGVSLSSADFVRLKNDCENLVQKRRVSEFKKFFQEHHKSFFRSPGDFGDACEWLRRLGLFHVGLRFSGCSYHGPRTNRSLRDPLRLQKIFWTARFLWALGCQQYALQLISDIPSLAPEDHKALADIYQTQGLFHKAIESLTIYLSKARLIPFVIKNEKLILPNHYNSLGYSVRMAFISLADAYAGLGSFVTAFSILDQVEKFLQQSTPSFEPLVLGICRQARAEYLSQQNKFELALIEILNAEKFFIHDDQSLDQVFFF